MFVIFPYHNFCYFSTEIEDKCVLCVTAGTNADSTMQAFTGSALPDSTQVYYKQGKTWQREYEIGKATVTSFYEYRFVLKKNGEGGWNKTNNNNMHRFTENSTLNSEREI